MLLEATPARQQRHNDEVHKGIRLVSWLSGALIAFSLCIGVALYFNLQSQSQEPTITAADGSTSIGFAVPVAPEYVLTTAAPEPGSQLAIGSDKIPVTVVRTGKPNGIQVTLLHLSAPLKVSPSLRALQNGEAATAKAATGSWEGTLSEGAPGSPIEAQPGISTGDIAPIVARIDGALLGISAPGAKGDVVISVHDLIAAFPELKR